MSLCINPSCQNPDNPDSLLRCQSCESELLLEGRYRVISLLGEGGFGKTYEVSNRGTLQVLKVLTKNQAKPVEQFQREAEVLNKLNYPGIPQGEEYFTFFPHNSKEPVHCLVMEKIEGENLQEWIEKRDNRPISEKQALDWLSQLAKTLHEVHQQQLIHRDIKPSNIMLKPDGQLVLIDFGIVREITATYQQKQASGLITTSHTHGYAPLEQVCGCAVPQSDFFALGRTFVYLLTGKHPQEIGNNYRDPNTDDEWNWRGEASKVSPILADFIDHLMAKASKNRPADTQAILQRLIEIEQTLYPKKLHQTKSSNPQTGVRGLNISLERTLGSWHTYGHSDKVWSIAISPDGQTLVSGGSDRLIKIWNLETGEEIYTITGNEGAIFSVAISPDGQRFVSGSGDSTIKVWDFSTGKEIYRINGHFNEIFSIAISSDEQKFISGSDDKTVRIWKLITGVQIRTLYSHSDAVMCVTISPDGSTVASGSRDKTIIVWSKQVLTGHSESVDCVTISPDSRLLVSSSSDNTIKVWNLSTGEEIYTINEESDGVFPLAISPDGQILASGSKNGKIKVWDLCTGENICTFIGHSDQVNALVFSSDGQRLVSASSDSTIKVWKIQ